RRTPGPRAGPRTAANTRQGSMAARSFRAPLLPELADEPQLAADRVLDAAELGRDLGVGVAFHFQHGHRAQDIAAEAVQPAVILLGHLGRERRRRLLSD